MPRERGHIRVLSGSLTQQSTGALTLGTRGDVPFTPASVKALRPLRGAQKRAALTDASAPGEALS